MVPGQTATVTFHDELLRHVTSVLRHRSRVLVAIDGPDAAGKTTLADDLATRWPLPVVRASIDSFHHPREVRMRRGPLSPEGYYRDSFDLDRFVGDLLEPFRAGATDLVTGVFDHRHEAAADASVSGIPATAVLVVDGVFLLRPELRDRWDVSVYLDIPPEETLRRARIRDVELFGSVAEVDQRYTARYLPGQALYRAEADPQSYADFVVDATDPTRLTPDVARNARTDRRPGL